MLFPAPRRVLRTSLPEKVSQLMQKKRIRKGHVLLLIEQLCMRIKIEVSYFVISLVECYFFVSSLSKEE